MSYTKSKAVIGLGTILSIGTTGATPTYTVVGEIKTIQQSGRQVATEDVTNMQSLGREFIPTLIDSGTWDISGARIGTDAGQIAMEAAFNNPGAGVVPFEIVCAMTPAQTTKGDTFTFNALVQEVNYDFSVEKAQTFTAKLKVSGINVYTPGT